MEKPISKKIFLANLQNYKSFNLLDEEKRNEFIKLITATPENLLQPIYEQFKETEDRILTIDLEIEKIEAEAITEKEKIEKKKIQLLQFKKRRQEEIKESEKAADKILATLKSI